MCRNTEDIEWNGHTWQAFPFELGKVSEDKSGSIPSFEIRIDNTSQALTYYVEASNGANNGEVVFYIVNTKALTVTTAEVEEHYRITKLTVTEQWVTATVGTSYNPHSRRPEGKYVKNSCRYKESRGLVDTKARRIHRVTERSQTAVLVDAVSASAASPASTREVSMYD